MDLEKEQHELVAQMWFTIGWNGKIPLVSAFGNTEQAALQQSKLFCPQCGDPRAFPLNNERTEGEVLQWLMDKGLTKKAAARHVRLMNKSVTDTFLTTQSVLKDINP